MFDGREQAEEDDCESDGEWHQLYSKLLLPELQSKNDMAWKPARRLGRAIVFRFGMVYARL